MKSDSISCVVPTLNSAATLDATLQSLRAQRGVAVRILVADSGSTDGTLDICRRWNVPTIYAEPGNMYYAINAALAECDSEWLAYLNSDDWLYPDGLARLLAAGAEADVVYGHCDYADGAGRFMHSFAAAPPRDLLPLFRLGRMGLAQPAAVFRRLLYHRLDGFDERYRFKADADFYLRALQAGARFAFCDGPPVACFRVHAAQLSQQQQAAIEAEGERLFTLRPEFRDWLALLRWRWRNAPHYSIRVLRAFGLSGRLRIPRSIERE
jgi:glycosyltransferase involved in cell wall biosynthesis